MIFLGLGSNLHSSFGDRFVNINLAISYLEQYDIQIVKRSSFYETPSYPNKSNPKFINIVISVNTGKIEKISRNAEIRGYPPDLTFESILGLRTPGPGSRQKPRVDRFKLTG